MGTYPVILIIGIIKILQLSSLTTTVRHVYLNGYATVLPTSQGTNPCCPKPIKFVGDVMVIGTRVCTNIFSIPTPQKFHTSYLEKVILF